MHGNLGITFDLSAIREDVPMNEIESFSAVAGLSSDIPREGNAVVWVLIDCETRFKAQVDQPGVAVDIDVEIEKLQCICRLWLLMVKIRILKVNLDIDQRIQTGVFLPARKSY